MEAREGEDVPSLPLEALLFPTYSPIPLRCSCCVKIDHVRVREAKLLVHPVSAGPAFEPRSLLLVFPPLSAACGLGKSWNSTLDC